MDNVYQYPVYFECHGLQEQLTGKIQLYFRNRRKSGGGMCGSLRRVKDDVYSIAFEDKEDQHRVLQRHKHEVAGCFLVLTVEAQNTTSASSQEYTQSPKSVPASTPPSGEKYELRPDTFLIRYLSECPKAWDKLQSELATMACSAQIFPEEGTLLVRSVAQPEVADTARKWKSEVDKLFDGFLCHYEVDAHKVRSLLQPCSSSQTTDEVKVYSEDGMVVVVGKRSQVNWTLKHHESPLSEKQTKSHQLGGAKLCLRWKEINHSLKQKFPGLKVSQGDLGQLILEGSMEEIAMAVDFVSDMEKDVLERTFSDMTPHLMTFLKKGYGGPGVLADVLGVDGEVVIELQDTELHFFSLSVDKLDYAVKALQGEFSEVKLEVPSSSALPSELWEKLKSKTKRMNQGQCKAQAVFISDGTVCLLGRSKEVEELSETVTQFISDESRVQSISHLPLPDKLPNEGNPGVGSYSLGGGLQVLVCQGDITKVDADVLVNAANEKLDHCGGVAGGPQVQKESKALVKQMGNIATGDVVVTTGGNLKCKKLFHAVGPIGGRAGGREKLLLEKTVRSALDLAELMQFKSIALPCISSGVFGVPVTMCSEAIVTAVKQFGSQGGRSLSKIILIDVRGDVVRAMREACDRILQGIGTGDCTPSDGGIQMAAAAQDPRGATAGAPGDGVHVEVVQGTLETQQVDALVSPMVGHDPLSTRIGNTLFNTAGSQITARFRKVAEEETMPGDTVLVEDLSGLPANAVFFLNLARWDEDQDGTAVEVLRLAINNLLTSCEQRGFTSVALPVLGTGIALRFPAALVASVLLKEIHAFRQSRTSRTPLLIRITIHPNDKESSEAFSSVQEAFTKELYQPVQGPVTKRIVLLGKTGTGKSSLANTIFGENLFTTNHSPNSGTKECQAETRVVSERSITLIDTPGLFDAERSEEEVKPEILSCVIECTPGPHAFLILLKVDKFTKQEKDVVAKICEYFSEDALKYAVVVFTHGEQLPEEMKIEDFVRQNQSLRELVKKCGGRCHVLDNVYWKNKPEEDYRSNQFQVEELLNTIDKMVLENNGGYYTNEMLKVVEEEIKKEVVLLKQSSGNMQLEHIGKRAKNTVWQRLLIQLAGTATGVLLGAFLGVKAMLVLFMTAVRNPPEIVKALKDIPTVRKALAGAAAGDVVVKAGIVLGAAAAVTGGVMGGAVGLGAADGADTVTEAVKRATKAVMDKERSYIG